MPSFLYKRQMESSTKYQSIQTGKLRRQINKMKVKLTITLNILIITFNLLRIISSLFVYFSLCWHFFSWQLAAQLRLSTNGVTTASLLRFMQRRSSRRKSTTRIRLNTKKLSRRKSMGIKINTKRSSGRKFTRSVNGNNVLKANS